MGAIINGVYQTQVTGTFTADDVTATDDVTSGDDVIVGDDVVISDTGVLWFGGTAATDTQFTSSETTDEFKVAVGSDQGRQIIITDASNVAKDHDHAAPTDPTLFVHSATDPDSDNTEWISLTHNRVNGVIESGKGAISFANSLIVGNNQTLTFGESFLRHHTGQSANTVVWSMGTSARSLIFCESGDHVFDFSHAQQINPTIFVHSANQATDEWISLSHNQTDPVIACGKGTLTVPTYVSHRTILANSAVLGPNAPTPTTIGVARGLGFDADNESAHLEYEVPDSWDGSSDLTFKIYWCGTSGDAIADTETVKWDLQYHSIQAGEAIDNGTTVTATATYTQSGAGTDKEFIETEITIDYDHADQPLAAGDLIVMQFDRDVTGDTYSGAGIVFRWEIECNVTKLGD